MQRLSLFVAAFSVLSHALIRFQCSQLVVQRLDPLVNPGQIPSAHVHQIVGGVGDHHRSRVRSDILTKKYRAHLMPQWTRQRTCRASPHAQPARSARTSPTTGPLFSTSAPGTAPLNVSRRLPRSAGVKAASRCTTCKTPSTTQSRSPKSRPSSP